MPHKLPCLIASLFVLVGCLGISSRAGSSGDRASGPEGARSRGNPIVISADQLAGRTSVLQVLQTRIANLQVRRTGDCPEIQIRGRKTLTTTPRPSVYVDGQRMANTCILELLNPEDVSQVEVYPTGVSSRPGYLGSAGGLILVFLKDGRAD